MSLAGKRIGNIRIVQLLGRGGMGEVYAGVDETLGRRVALKAIRSASRLDAGAQSRFLREARILGQLDHPNICRIFHYIEGEEMDFLVLELIEGRNLGEALARETFDHGRRLKIARQIASALKAAHLEGIIHRDLKPHNVMLTAAGDVKVLDFGLAYSAAQATRRLSERAEDATAAPPSPGESTPRIGRIHSLVATLEAPGPGIGRPGAGGPSDPDPAPGLTEAPTGSHPQERDRTRQGAIVGTPGYMSPEQAQGRPATTASDMYSFGLLLHRLFTGERVYPADLDGPALIEKARRAEIPPLRGIGRDLSSLIARLTSAAPAARPTAAAVVEELEWIHDKPRRRLRRLLAAATLALLSLFAVKYTLDLRRERNIAELRRGQAEDLISFMLGDLREKLEPVGRLDVLDDVGDKALDYFASLSEEELSDQELFRRSKALSQIGEVRIAQGDLDSAMRSFQEARALAANLVARAPEQAEWQSGLGTLEFWIGYVHWLQSDLDEAERRFHAYLDSSNRLVALEPGNADWRIEVANAHSTLGSLLDARGDAAGALERFRTYAEIVRALVKERPSRTSWQAELADGLSWLGRALQAQGDLAGALEHYLEGQALLVHLSQQDPGNTNWKYLLGISHNHVARLLTARGELAEARIHADSSLRVHRSLTSRDPDNSDWQRELAVAHQRLGSLLVTQGEIEAAFPHLEEADRILRRLHAQDESNTLRRRDLAGAMIALGQARAAAGSLPAALRAVQPAMEVLDALLEESPQDREALRLLGEGANLQGVALARSGQERKARASWERAVVALQGERDADNVFLLDPLASALLRLDRTGEALPLVQRLADRGYRTVELHRLCRAKGVTTMG